MMLCIPMSNQRSSIAWTMLRMSCCVMWVALTVIFSPKVLRSQEQTNDTATLQGRVVGPDNQPVLGARIYMAVSDRRHQSSSGYGTFQEELTLLGTSSASGDFKVTAQNLDASISNDAPVKIVAFAPQNTTLGPDWDSAYVFNVDEKAIQERVWAQPKFAGALQSRRTLRLAKSDIPIRGRILLPSGKPVAGANVRVVNVQQLKEDNLHAYVNIARLDGPINPYDDARNKHLSKTFFGERGRRTGFGQLLSTRTDADGKFEIKGIGDNRVAWLEVEGDGMVSESLLVRMEEGEATRMRDGTVYFSFYPAAFEHTANEGTQLDGVVRDIDTGDALANVVVESLPHDSSRQNKSTVTRTDAQGRFSIRGFPFGEDVELLASTHGTPYLPSFHSHRLSATTAPGKGCEIRMKKGVWTEGRVTDAETKSPVPAFVHYFLFSDTPGAAELPGFRGLLSYPGVQLYTTDTNGRYRVPTLPGRGLITISVSAGGCSGYANYVGVPRIEGAIEEGMWTTFNTLPSECRAAQFHALKAIEPTAGKDLLQQDFELRPAKRLTVRVTDEAGNDVRGFRYAGVGDRSFHMTQFVSDRCIIDSYNPDFPRRVIVCHEALGLAGTIVLTGEYPELPVIQLQRHGILKGRVVGENGEPLAGIDLTVAPLISPASPTSISATPKPAYRTDEDGRFEIVGVAAGLKYNLVTTLPKGVMRQVVFDASTGAGQTTDLGDLPLRPLATPGK